CFRTRTYHTLVRLFGYGRFLFFFYRRFNFFSLFIHVSRRLCFYFLFLLFLRLQILFILLFRFHFLLRNFSFRLLHYRLNLLFLRLLFNRFSFWLRCLRRCFLYYFLFLGLFLRFAAFKAI